MRTCGPHRSLTGLSDLLRVAVVLAREVRDAEVGANEAARILGYTRNVQSDQETAPPPSHPEAPVGETVRLPVTGPERTIAGVTFWQPTTFRWSDDATHRRATRWRDDADDAAVDRGERQEMLRNACPSTPPLSPRSRLAPMLQRSLLTDALGHTLDVPGLVRRWSRGELLARLPRLRRRGWPALVLLLDRGHRLVPFWRDQLDLRKLLYSLVGGAGLVVRFFDDRGPDGPAFDERGRPTDLLDGSLAGLPVLALTDLGWYGGPRLRRSWLRLGRQLQRAGVRRAALVPVPTSRWTSALMRVWAAIPWERPAMSGTLSPEERQARVDRLLDLTAYARRLEPGLLRALRNLLPRTEADIGTEADAWQHEDMLGMSADATALRPDRAPARRERFARAPLATRTSAARLFHAWHWQRERRPELWYTEALALAESGRQVVGEDAIGRAEAFMGRLRRRVMQLTESERANEQRQALRRWLDQTAEYTPALFDPRTAAGRDLQITWWATHDTSDPPPAADPTLIALARDEMSGEPEMYMLRQIGGTLELCTPERSRSRSVSSGGAVAPLWAAAPLAFSVSAGAIRSRLVPGAALPLPRGDAASFEIRTDCATIGLEQRHKPGWAAAMGRDRHGLWVDVEVLRVPFRLRWIPPGRFMMGSLWDEKGRWSWLRTQREVIVERGFWLAEAPVTQALWQASMVENPSRFKDHARPVERVSWADAQEFIAQLNELVEPEDGGFRLPSEVEWEYACRAGTTTDTYAGDLKSPDTYAGDRKSRGRWDTKGLDKIAWYGENTGYEDLDDADAQWLELMIADKKRPGTQRVKQKLPNPWGLYDMLGNVWEWCSDEYADEVVSVATSRTLRACRGGSWHNLPWHTRAAARLGAPPDHAEIDRGLRLARGPGFEDTRAAAQGESERAPAGHEADEVRPWK